MTTKTKQQQQCQSSIARDPALFQINLPADQRPPPTPHLAEEWFPQIETAWPHCTSKRRFDPMLDIRAIVIHATAGASSIGAISVMKARRASFHWLVPDENEPAHGHFVWACAPEARAAWHVHNSCCHPDIWQGRTLINHYSLGIELVNKVRGDDQFSDWQIQATANIIRYAWGKYPNLAHVVSHARLDPGRRTDPGAHFPWEKLTEAILSG